MRRPVIGVIGNMRLIENRFTVQMCGETNLRAVAEVAGALPMMFAGCPGITDIGALLDTVDGILLTGGRANVHPRRFGVEAHPRHEPYDERRDDSRWRWSMPASNAACRCSASAAAFRR